jgi:two-component system chemotaxis response regulator CheB
MSQMTRVLICEDSRTYATALARALEHDSEIGVVGVCPTAEDAIEALPRLQPDLLTMDLELPGMSGLQAVEEIMSARPVPILVISSHIDSQSSALVAAALAAGALDALPKDDLDLGDAGGVAGTALRRRVKLLSAARVLHHPRVRLTNRRPPARADGRTARVIGICASTGGPHVLLTVLRQLPATYSIPILVVQHIAAGFTEGFARWLDGEIKLPLAIARGGERLAPGVWIAREGSHLVVGKDRRLTLDRDTHAQPHRPSGDVLLRSIAEVMGPESVGIVLTGMGRDGAEGLAAIQAAGGLTIAQDEASSAVYGMPRAAADSAELILPYPAIGARIAALRLAKDESSTRARAPGAAAEGAA